MENARNEERKKPWRKQWGLFDWEYFCHASKPSMCSLKKAYPPFLCVQKQNRGMRKLRIEPQTQDLCGYSLLARSTLMAIFSFHRPSPKEKIYPKSYSLRKFFFFFCSQLSLESLDWKQGYFRSQLCLGTNKTSQFRFLLLT